MNFLFIHRLTLSQILSQRACHLIASLTQTRRERHTEDKSQNDKWHHPPHPLDGVVEDVCDEGCPDGHAQQLQCHQFDTVLATTPP